MPGIITSRLLLAEAGHHHPLRRETKAMPDLDEQFYAIKALKD